MFPTRYYQKTDEMLHKEVAKLRKKLNAGKQEKEKEETAAEKVAPAASAETEAEKKAKKERRKKSVCCCRGPAQTPAPTPSATLTFTLVLTLVLSMYQVLGDIDLDEDSGVPIGEQLKQALVKNAGKMMDLFREWDEDGDGEITRKEFRAAMLRMQLEVPQPDVDSLFDSWDPSGGGKYLTLTQTLTQTLTLTPLTL